jgi:phosphatidate cytidylyltransferase
MRAPAPDGADAAAPRASGAGDAAFPVRVLSALFLAPVFVAAAYAGGFVFLAVVGLLAAVGAWEFGRLALGSRLAARAIVVLVGLAAVALRFVWPGSPEALTALVTGGILVALLAGLTESDPSAGVRTASLTLLGALYVGWLFSSLVGLREMPREVVGLDYAAGFVLLATPVLVVWATDIGAYFAGRAWGRRKLLPRVSPRKTVAGAVGGAASAGVVAALLFIWAPVPLPRLGAPAGAALGAAMSLLAQAGDLAESLLKRAFGVKDTSRLIPGHGGVLDRFDSLLFTAPAAYHLFRAVLA